MINLNIINFCAIMTYYIGLSQLGYEFRYLQRTGSKTDAVAFFIKKKDFKILGSENVLLCSQSDRVGLILWLQHKLSGTWESSWNV